MCYGELLSIYIMIVSSSNNINTVSPVGCVY